MRKLQKTLSAVAIFAVAGGATAMADVYDIKVERVTIDSGDFKRTGVGFNGGSPGPVLRFTEGEQVTLNVTNALTESTSIHWHGLILPYQQDGVPTISFDGIEPGETFTYSFPIIQSGTYWYHSHSNLQEPEGAFGAIVITPKGGERAQSDREHVLVLNDAHPHTSHRILRNLKMMPDYYNRKQRTAGDFIEDVKNLGLEATLSDRADWGQMRMMPTDIEDLQGFTPMINGKGPEQNWTGLFKPGEKVRLRFVNASAMTYFDVRIPGLKFTVVQADGNDVEPVEVDEFRIGVAETYDVIVQPDEDKAYTIFAESMGRSAFARGTLATENGMAGFVPELRPAPLLTMADMGMSHGGMDHAAMGHGAPETKPVDHAAMGHGTPKPEPVDHAAMGHGDMNHGTMADAKPDSFYAPGSGLEPVAANGGKVLSYNDLRAANPLYEDREPTREIELRLTGNMERYMWSINGVKYGDAESVRLKYGERVRFKFVNETMMTHPMHLHGMWTIIDVGAGQWNPIKHTVSVAPGSTVYTETEVDAPGQWAFHCHLAYHAASGMFRKIVVEGGPDTAVKSGQS
jgi:CopA family copper-resistance protein